MRIALASVLLVAATSNARADGRFASVAVGGSVTTTEAGEDPPDVPALLQHAPELQISWGLHAGNGVIVTRLDVLGAIVPVGPTGVGLDVGAGWTPRWREAGWAPVVRGFVGGIVFGSGGEMMGPDHASHGFRMSVEAGAVHRRVVPAGTAAWGIVVGAQAIGLVSVDPCSATGDCSTALLGFTARLEGSIAF